VKCRSFYKKLSDLDFGIPGRAVLRIKLLLMLDSYKLSCNAVIAGKAGGLRASNESRDPDEMKCRWFYEIPHSVVNFH